MKNFKTLLKQEFLRHIHSFKFSLMLIVSLIVTLVCVYIQIKDFEDRQQNYFEEVTKAEELKKSFLVFSEFKIPILIKPNPLSIFAKGYDEKIGNKIIISATETLEFQTTSQRRNPFLDIFLNFDVISIVQIILSILTIFLVADAISGEREDETLKLVFANHVNRFEYFLSKFVGSLFTLSIPLVFIFLMASLMIVLQPFIALSSLFWLKVLLIFICCLGLISIYILIGLMVSAKTASSSLSVIFGLLIWIVLVSIYPNTINYVVSESVSIPSADVINDQIKQVEEKAAEQCNENLYNFRGPVSFSLMSSGDCYEGLPDIVGVTEKATFEHIEMAVKKNFPIVRQCLQTISNINDDFRNRLLRQRTMTSFFLKFLPGFMLEESSTKIANTDYWFREFTLRSKARDFLQVVMDYLKSKDAFGLKFFTQMTREEMKDDYREYSREIFEKYSDRESYPRLNLNDVPVFTYSESIGFSMEILFIFMSNILLFLVGVQFFSRADLRKRG